MKGAERAGDVGSFDDSGEADGPQMLSLAPKPVPTTPLLIFAELQVYVTVSTKYKMQLHTTRRAVNASSRPILACVLVAHVTPVALPLFPPRQPT